jgi:hypothetical protein
MFCVEISALSLPNRIRLYSVLHHKIKTTGRYATILYLLSIIDASRDLEFHFMSATVCGHSHCFGCAFHCVSETDGQTHASLLRRSTKLCAKHIEYVVKIKSWLTLIETKTKASGKPLLVELIWIVVLCPLIGITEDSVCFFYLLESGSVSAAVRMMSCSSSTIGLFDFFYGCAAIYTKSLI